MTNRLISLWKTYCAETRERLTATRKMRILGWVVSGLFVLFLYFLAEMYNFRSLVLFFRFIYLHPKSALLGVLITAAVYGFWLLLTRPWIAAIICGALYQIGGLINFFKVDFNGDPFVPWDLSMAGNTGQLLSFIKFSLPWWAWELMILLAAYIVLLWLWRPTSPKWYVRIPLSVLFPALLILCLQPWCADVFFRCFGIKSENAALQKSNYRANGIVSGFYLNLSLMSPTVPDGYSAETMAALLKDYTDTAGGNPDIIVILCESYWDVRQLPDTTFSEDPLYFFDELCTRDNAYSGTMYSTAIGGGTVRPEFHILTGFSTDALPSGISPYIYADSAIGSIPAQYKAAGYRTLAMHPYDKSFYSRNRAYPYLAFDDFYGKEDIQEMADVTYQRNYISDDSFADAIIHQLEQSQDTPTFLFGITMENHQSYKAMENYEITVQNPHLNEKLLATVNTYTQGVLHSTRALEKLVNYIDTREKDTVLVFFGDHLPTLGSGYAAYQATGLFSGNSSDTEQRKIMYGTPFVIYGNFPLNDTIIPHTQNEISDYYLLSLTAAIADTHRSSYMNWLLSQFQKVPYYNSRLSLPVTPDVQALTRGQNLVTYDRLIGKGYSQ